MYCHYLKKYQSTETNLGLWAYIFSRVDSTLYAVAGMVSGIIGLQTHGIGISPHHLVLAFLIGYTSDNLLNKG
jgi:hypothetical protein